MLSTPESHLNSLCWFSCDLSLVRFPLWFVVAIYQSCIENTTAKRELIYKGVGIWLFIHVPYRRKRRCNRFRCVCILVTVNRATV